MMHRTGPWAHPPRKRRRALPDRLGFWVLVAALVLAGVIYLARVSDKAITEAAIAATYHEVIR